MPLTRSSPGAKPGCEITGTMVRVIRFQSSLSVIGRTGWMLRTFCVWWSGPALNVVLFCKGRLIMLAIGFCAALANASVSSPDAAPAASDSTAMNANIIKQTLAVCCILAFQIPNSVRR